MFVLQFYAIDVGFNNVYIALIQLKLFLQWREIMNELIGNPVFIKLIYITVLLIYNSSLANDIMSRLHRQPLKCLLQMIR